MASDDPPLLFESPPALSASSSTADLPANGHGNGPVEVPNSADISTTDTSSDDHHHISRQVPLHSRPRRASSSLASRRLSFTTANSSLSNRPRLDVAELAQAQETSSEGSDDDVAAALGRGPASSSKPPRSRRHTIVSPFSRPPSAVTSFGGPSRPGSTAVDSVKSSARLTPSAGMQRRATPSSSKLSTLPPSPPEWVDPSVTEQAEPRRRSSRDEEPFGGAGDVKGKGKALERTQPYEIPLTDDPFDPLSAMRRGSPSNFGAELEASRRARQSSTRKRQEATPLMLQQSDQRVQDSQPVKLSSVGAPLSATSYPSSDSVASTSRITISSNGQSDPSSVSSAPASSAHQPSLQQLLQTVDLTAALRLVQTLQTKQQAPPPTNILVTPPVALPLPSTPSYASFPPISPPAAALPPRQAPLSLPDQFPNSSSHPHLSPPADSTSPVTPTGVSTEEKKDRRRSLSIGFGVNTKGKRARTTSTISESQSQREGLLAGLGRVKERVPDERAAMTEAARSFEEQISRVHLALSPSTLRRAQNCAKYISLRYTPIYSALAANASLPNPVNVARWRQEKEELERRQRRFKTAGASAVGRLGKVNGVGLGNESKDDLGFSADGDGTARGRPSDAGSSASASSPLSGQLPSYGPRRNKYPKAWEIYPEEIVEYVASGGGMHDPAEAGGGAALKTGISTLSRSPSRLLDSGRSALTSTSPSSAHPATNSPMLNASPSTVDRSQLFGGNSKGHIPNNRPDYSRQSSYEGSQNGKTSFPRSPVDFQGSSSLQRASSVTSTAGGLASAAGLAAAFTKVGDAPAIGNGYGSPRSRVASARASRDFLPSPASHNDPSSPRALVGAHSPLLHDSPNQMVHHHKSSPSSPALPPGGGVRSGISRRLGRIRGRNGTGPFDGGDTSDGRGGQIMSRRGSHDHASPDVSDMEGHRSPRVSSQRLRSPQRGPFAHLSDTGGNNRRPTLRKNASSYDFSRGFDTDGYKSSGGEETSRRRPVRGIFSTAWQGFKGSLDVYAHDDPMPFGSRGTPAAAAAAAARIAEISPQAPIRRRVVAYESDEEEVKPPREVLDLGDDEYTQLNSSLRQLRAQISHIDTLIPRVPGLLSFFLDEIESHETTTRDDLGLSVEYSFPRLPASVIVELANIKSKQHAQPPLQYSTSDSSSTSSESTSSESSSSEGSDDERQVISSSPRSRPHRLPRHQSHKVHIRHATDQVAPRQIMSRPRSHTTAFVFGSNGHPLNSQRASTFANRPDPLDVLEKTIRDLEKVTKGIDEDAEKVQAQQEKVDAEITKVVAAVDEAQKSIDDTGFQRLRMLEDHYFRLRASLTRPSSSIDALWALLAGALTVVFWLSWLFVTFFRIVRRIITLPISVFRWLFFLR